MLHAGIRFCMAKLRRSTILLNGSHRLTIKTCACTRLRNPVRCVSPLFCGPVLAESCTEHRSTLFQHRAGNSSNSVPKLSFDRFQTLNAKSSAGFSNQIAISCSELPPRKSDRLIGSVKVAATQISARGRSSQEARGAVLFGFIHRIPARNCLDHWSWYAIPKATQTGGGIETRRPRFSVKPCSLSHLLDSPRSFSALPSRCTPPTF